MTENLGPDTTPENWGTPNPAWNHIGSLTRDWSLDQTPDVAPNPKDSQGPSPAAPAGIEQYRAPRRKGPVFIGLAAIAAVLVVLFFVAQRTTSTPGSQDSPTPSQAYSPTIPLPTGGQFANAINFTSSKGAGIFAIEDSRWESDYLLVDVKLTLAEGELDFDFAAMDMASGDVTFPEQGTDYLDPQIIDAGEEVSGTIRFSKQRGDTQIILSDLDTYTNVTMLAVKG